MAQQKMRGSSPRLARYHPFGEGHEQARSVPGLEQGTGQGQLPRLATEDLQKNSAEHKLSRAQGCANFKIPTLKRTSSRPGDTNAASHTDRNKDIMRIIHIHGRHSPPPRLNLTTHVTKPTLQQLYDPTKIVPDPAYTIPSLRGRTRASPAGSRT